MKSLELINERIESTLKAEDKLKMELQLCFYKDEANCIKQDLEVLEILRKHLYIHTSYGDSDYGEYEDKSICINEIHECFCKEHFNKIKQWLEEN